MDAGYYKEYFHFEREHWYFQARNNIIIDHIAKVVKDKGNIKILNVGAGTGHTSQLLEKFGIVKSLEYDKDCFEFVKERLDIDIINGSILELPFDDNEFDLVCAFDVIEHIEDDQLGVDELKRVCKEGGIVSVTVPAFMFLWSNHDEVNHHYRRYTKPQLLNLFNVKEKFLFHSYYNFWLFFPIAFFRWINNFFTITKKNEHNAGSDFDVLSNFPLLSKMLYKVFYSESYFIKKFISLPVGVSVIASWQK